MKSFVEWGSRPIGLLNGFPDGSAMNWNSVNSWVHRNVILLGLFLLLISGSFLRLHGLGSQSLWNDELASWHVGHYESLETVIRHSAVVDVHPPGYSIFLYGVQNVLGDSESDLRLPSAVAGIASILMIFLLGTQLYSKKEGLIAAALMAFSWCPIYYSQEARPYALLLLFALVSTSFWIVLLRDLERPGSPRLCLSAIGYVVSAILISYLHYFGVLLIALQGIGFLFGVRTRKSLLNFVVIYVAILLAYLPWAGGLWHHLKGPPGWIPVPDSATFRDFLSFCFNDSLFVLYCILPFTLLFMVRGIRALRSKAVRQGFFRISNPTWLLLLWLGIPFSIAYLQSMISTPVLTNRNLIISLPAVYLLLSRSITQLPVPAWGKWISVAGLILILLFQNIVGKRYYSTPQKGQFREAVEYIVEAENRAQLNSMMVGHAWSASYFNYYFGKMGSDRRIDLLAGEALDIPVFSKRLDETESQTIWVVSGHRVLDPEFLSYLNSRLNLMDNQSFFVAV